MRDRTARSSAPRSLLSAWWWWWSWWCVSSSSSSFFFVSVRSASSTPWPDDGPPREFRGPPLVDDERRAATRASSIADRRVSTTRRRRRRRWRASRTGTLVLDFGTRSSSVEPRTTTPSDDDVAVATRGVTVTIDPSSAVGLLSSCAGGLGATLSAFAGTLRLLGPLIVSRRALVGVWAVVEDYVRGRYFRVTYSRIQRVYLRYYETPAAARAFCRIVSQVVFQWYVLSPLLGVLFRVGDDDASPTALRGALWVGAVLGVGHFFSRAVARWGGPLRVVQATAHHHRSIRSTITNAFTQPHHVLQWMQEPDRWLRSQTKNNLARKPNPIMYPLTWAPLRILQVCALAKIVSADLLSDRLRRATMRSFLLQTALGDEWYRVFLEERRVGLGIPVVVAHVLALTAFVVRCAAVDAHVAAFLLPSVVAGVLSAWMNVAVFWNLFEEKKADAALNDLSWF